ncbi:MAG: tetratricopeptide repeat protein, partial [Dongiaceae bacterium]
MMEVRRPFGLDAAAAIVIALCWLVEGSAIAADLSTASLARPAEPSAFGSFLAGRHAQDVKDFGSAADFLAEVLAGQSEDVSLLQDTFIAMASEGRFVEAADIGRRLQALGAQSETINLILALQDLKAGDLEAATTDVEKLSTDGLGRFTVPLVRAWVYLEGGKLDAALAAMQPLSGVAGVQSLNSLHLGLINELGGRPAEAAKAYEETTQDTEKLSFRVVEIVGNFYLRQGQADKAQALYERFRAAYPDNPLIGLTIAESKAGRKATAVAATPRQGLAEAL